MRSSQLIAPLYLLVAISSAWTPLEALKREVAPLLPRQDEKTSYDLSYSATQGDTATSDASTAEQTDGATTTDSNSDSSATPTSNDASDATSDATSTGTQKGSQIGSATGSVTGSGTGKASGTTGSGKNTKSATPTAFDPRLPAGGVQMVTPAAIATSYYKIKDYVTFGWNYTSLSVTPSAVDVMAFNSLNSVTYTIATNLSITAPTQAVTWDTGDYQATAATTLLTGTYTLIIHDAAKDVSATPAAGYLGTYNQFTFGMYLPQKYTPMAEYVCVTCNAGVSSMERQTVISMMGMVALTVLSFGWFAGVAGLI